MISTTPSSAPVKLPFFEKLKTKIDAPPVVQEEAPLSPLSADSDYGGLAYADSEDDFDPPPPPPASAPATTSHHHEDRDDHDAPAPPPKSATTNRVRFPSMKSVADKSESNYSNSPGPSPRLPMRSLSAASTAASAYALRSAAKSTADLERAMETLFEEDPVSPTATSNSTPAMFALGDSQRDSKPPKLPTRSHTSPTMGAGRPDSRHGIVAGKRRERASKKVCLKCDKHIDDGRWIQMDGGGVLCDKCWKNMYLPKVSPRWFCGGYNRANWVAVVPPLY